MDTLTTKDLQITGVTLELEVLISIKALALRIMLTKEVATRTQLSLLTIRKRRAKRRRLQVKKIAAIVKKRGREERRRKERKLRRRKRRKRPMHLPRLWMIS